MVTSTNSLWEDDVNKDLSVVKTLETSHLTSQYIQSLLNISAKVS